MDDNEPTDAPDRATDSRGRSSLRAMRRTSPQLPLGPPDVHARRLQDSLQCGSGTCVSYGDHEKVDMVNGSEPSTTLLVTLTVMTVVSGVVDAVSYLGLGHVFTANMTGNVVLLGFAAAGAAGILNCGQPRVTRVLPRRCSCGREDHVARDLASVMAADRDGDRRDLYRRRRHGCRHSFRRGGVRVWAVHDNFLCSPSPWESGTPPFGGSPYPDITTTVLTMTLTGLAADSSLAGGSNPKVARRTSAVAAMLVGAVVGAALYLHTGTTWPLVVVAGIVLATTVAFAISPGSRQLDVVGSSRGSP